MQTSVTSNAQAVEPSSTLRVAWVGGVGLSGGVGGITALLLDGVLRQGVEVDYYAYNLEDVPSWLQQHKNLTIIATPPQWSWDRWYSRNAFLAFVTGTLARIKAYDLQCDKILANHAAKPYSCIFQVSQTELFKLGKNLHRLPPVIIYPCVHAAGELRWHRQESAYALQSENAIQHYLTRLLLIYRTRVQKRELTKPTMIVGMSQRFNDLVAADYDVAPERQAVLYHAIWQQEETAIQKTDEAAKDRAVIKLIFVARISVRKGLQYIVELSKRLDDLAGQIQIDVIGDRTQWSDYRAHLKNLNPNTARYLGGKNHKQVAEIYDESDILLLPSLYEPGGIVIGEALSHGLCVVASDAIGSAEVLDGDCHREFSAGDMDQLEQQVRQLIKDLKTHRQELRDCAREQCKQYFSPDKIAKDFLQIVEQVVEKKSSPQ